MTDVEKKQTGGPQAMLRGLLIVVALVVVGLCGVFAYQRLHGRGGEGPQQVGMLDSEAIYAMPEFTRVKKDLGQMSEAMQGEYQKQSKKMRPEEQESLRLQMRTKLEQEQAKRLKPLNDRVSAAIATLAVERKYRVVLDKKIVVTGVSDVTEDVKKKFQENPRLEAPKQSPELQSNVGYISQEAVGELRIYKEANAKLVKFYQQLGQEFAKKGAKLTPAEKEKMRVEMARQFQEMQAEIFKPVNDKVNMAITEVAKEKGLSLVLESHHIMWGGRNLTDDVIKKLLQARG